MNEDLRIISHASFPIEGDFGPETLVTYFFVEDGVAKAVFVSSKAISQARRAAEILTVKNAIRDGAHVVATDLPAPPDYLWRLEHD